MSSGERQLLVELARLHVGTWSAEALVPHLRRQTSNSWSRLLGAAFANGVGGLVVERLAYLQEAGSVAIPPAAVETLWDLSGLRERLLPIYAQTSESRDALLRLRAAARQYQRRQADSLARLLKAIVCCEARAMCIKGLAVRPLYPPDCPRDLADVDVLTESIDDGWHVISTLIGLGYTFDRLSLRKVSPAALGGEVEGRGPAGDIIDVHLGAFNVVCMSTLAAPLWERCERFEFLPGYAFPIPSLEDCLLIMVAHLSHHGFLTLRDVNDAYVLLQHASRDMDWEYVEETACVNELAPLLRSTLEHVENIYGPLPTTQELQPAHAPWAEAAARLMTRHSRPGHTYCALPYRGYAVLNYERKRYGMRPALHDLGALVGLTLEQDSWFWLRGTRSRQISFWLFRTLLHRHWKPSALRSWIHMAMDAVPYVMNGVAHHVARIDTARCVELGKLPGVRVTSTDQIVIWKTVRDVEFVITPAGIYHALQPYHDYRNPLRASQEKLLLRREAEDLVTYLTCHGAVALRPTAPRCR